MTILVTNYVSKRLEELKDSLKEIFPEAEVITEKDSLMAGKYCFFNHVDMVFADLDNRRMEGMLMEKFVHHSNPEAKFYLTGEMQDLLDWEIIDENGIPCDDGVSGVISYPVTVKKIKIALAGPAAETVSAYKSTIDVLYDRLLESEDLQNTLLNAASDNDLDSFFRAQGCTESTQEIKEYFREKIFDGQELSEDELQMVAGGTSVQLPFIKTIMNWVQDKS